MGTTDDLQSYYYGTKADLKVGNLIEPGEGPSDHVLMTETLDAAAWDGELEAGDGTGRIYIVVPTGPIAEAPDPSDKKYPGPTKTYRSRYPLRVTGEATDAQGRPPRLYHGTKARLEPGDLIEAGHSANFGQQGRLANFVYLTGTLDAAIWGAELALGGGPGRIYVVEPTGPIMDDPNLTNARFPGNPTKSYRSRDPLRITGEVKDWQGHTLEAVEAMKGGLEKLKQQGAEPIDD